METNSSHQEDITLPSIMFNQVLTTIRGSVTNGTESTGWSLGHTTTLDDVTTHNTSIPPFFSQTTLQDHQINWSFVVIYCAVILVILAGNGLVVTAFFRFSFLQTVTNMFVVGVAITDALMACVGILRILTLIDPRLLSGYVPCMIRMGSGVINGVLSALMLTCIAFERCVGTFWPLQFQSLLTPTRARIILASVTLVTAVVIGVGLVASNQWTPETPCYYFSVFPPWLVALTTGAVFLSLIIILIIYLLIVRATLRLLRQTAPIDSVDESRQRMNRSLKPILNLVTIVVLFAVCYWPFCWATFLASRDAPHFLADEWFLKIYAGLLAMLLMNNMLNPLVYALRFKAFTVAFKLMFGMIPPSERHIAIESIQH